jgi:hypothetical protein
MLQTAASRLCLPLPVTWEVMWHWTVKVLCLHALQQKRRHLGCSLSQPPERFLARSAAENVLRSSSWSVSCSGLLNYPIIFFLSSCFPSALTRSENSRLKNWRKWGAWHTLFSRPWRRKVHKIWRESNKSCELHFPQLRQLRQVTWGLTSADVRLTSGLTWQLRGGLWRQGLPR